MTILIFFPDPWHKKRHHKRRLIDADFVETLAAQIRPGGVLRLATDWQDVRRTDARGLQCLQAHSPRKAPRGATCSGPTSGRRRDSNGAASASGTASGTSPTSRPSAWTPARKGSCRECRRSMNCTASAARTTPERRFMTVAPVTPRTSISRGAASIRPRHDQDHERDDRPGIRRTARGFPQTSPAVNKMVASAPGPGNERKRQRKHRDVLALQGFLVLGRGRSSARGAREHHVERNQEEQRAAGDPKRVQGNPHDVQKLRPHRARTECRSRARSPPLCPP